MKTSNFQIKIALSFILMPLILILIAGSAAGQNTNNKEKPGKQKYSIHILKDVNGEKTEIDTTFETTGDFDVEAWMENHDMGNDRDEDTKEMEKEVTVTIPHMSGTDMKSIPDTIIINGDTVVVNTMIEKMLKENPNLAELGMENFFNKHAEAPSPNEGNVQEGCPFSNHHDMSKMMPFSGFSFPELENFMPLGNLDQIVIKKKRHGKKIIISFEENDDDNIVIRHGTNDHAFYYNDNHSKRNHSKEKKVIIRKEVAPGTDAKDGSRVEHYFDGNKELIIIHEK
jgi:hypothetical protein